MAGLTEQRALIFQSCDEFTQLPSRSFAQVSLQSS